MGFTLSPLRYPGGKTRLAPFIRGLMEKNGLLGASYIEPFAGAAGVAWALLFDGSASRVLLNDIDPLLHAFWHSVLNETDQLCSLITRTRVTMTGWRRARSIIAAPDSHSLIEVGFAAFFLNRTNRSGVIRGGVIGGKAQSGAWTLDARYNKHDLVQRITRIARLRDRILIYRMDAAHFITTVVPTVTSKALVYIDPPYMNRGKDLYWNTYEAADHARLAKVVQETVAHPWIVTYDDAPATRRLYRDRARRTYQLSYSAATKTVGSEVMMFSLGLRMPRTGLPCQPSSTNA